MAKEHGGSKRIMESQVSASVDDTVDDEVSTTKTVDFIPG
jgi:hypothetical protein